MPVINTVKTEVNEKGVVQSLGTPSFTFKVPAYDQNGQLIGGGGGATVIADGGEVSGTYHGNVICEGQVTVTGELEVLGDMIVRGHFINDGGYPVTIRGDLFAQYIDFTKSDTSTAQTDFQVDGDLIFTHLDFPQCGGSAALLRVGGDLIGAYGITGTEIVGPGVTDGTPGLSIRVYGDMTVAYVYINGADGYTIPAGYGGNVTVYGSANMFEVVAEGGLGYNQDGGGGGYIDVYGSLEMGYGSVYLGGGDAYDGYAGSGGNLDVAGNMTINEIQLGGGDCYSDSDVPSGGNGGYLYIDGDAIVNSGIGFSGGDRYGTLLSSSYSSNSPSGGTVQVTGDLKLEGSLMGHGGNMYTDNYAPAIAGLGGNVYIYGNFTSTDDVNLAGGFSLNGGAGNGGHFEVQGNTYIDGGLLLYGGSPSNGDGGYGGNAYMYGNVVVTSINLSGGNGIGGNGGNGGELGGFSLLVYGAVDTSGGNCHSTDETHHAGYGGNVYCGVIPRCGVINTYGGDSFGATTTPNTGNDTANGGTLYCEGAASVFYIDNHGGSVYTDSPNSNGGNAGDINVDGNLFVSEGIDAYGGESDDSAGGSGGNISVKGDLVARYIDLDGADCDGGNAGNGGNIEVFGSLTCYDGHSAVGGNSINGDAGYGGSMTDIHGNINIGFDSIYLYGGDATNGNAGDSGYISTDGDLVVNELQMYGGYCGSNDENHRSGRGGSLTVDGDTTINDFINVSGGTREGTLTAGNTLIAPDAGILYIGGNLTMQSFFPDNIPAFGSFFGFGGSVLTNGGFSPQNGGVGSEITVIGDIICNNFFADGGSVFTGYAGNGGSITVFGSMTSDNADYVLTMSGTVASLSGGGVSGTGQAGDGGVIKSSGALKFDFLSMNGGSGSGGSAGNGGFVGCEDVLKVRSELDAFGGNCDSTAELDVAGVGGYVTCWGLNAATATLNLAGGQRTGDTTTTGYNAGPDGGNLDCFGDAIAYEILTHGGDVSTDYPNCPSGGNGGHVLVYGNLTMQDNITIDTSGGDSVGSGVAGNGGDVAVFGNATVVDAVTSGGTSYNSVGIGSDAGTSGQAGSMLFGGNLVAGSLSLLDGGAPGTAPTGDVRIALNGMCTVNEIDMSDRSACWIYSSDGKPVTLRVASLPTKKTLNDTSGNVTTDISGDLDDSIFISGISSTWKKIAGTDIMAA